MKKTRLFFALALPLAMASLVGCKKNVPLKISVQPQDASARLGETAKFAVKVNDESQVESYQWELLNVVTGVTHEETWVDIAAPWGVSSELVIPSVDKATERDYRCKITDKDGNVTVTERAAFTITGYQDSDIYCEVGARIITPGQTLDLEDTCYGTGKVSLSADGQKLTLDHVNYDNTYTEFDPFASGIAFYYTCYAYQYESLSIELKGRNTITNVYADQYGNRGVDFGMFFGSHTQNVVTKIEGTGSLTLEGGNHMIYCTSDLDIDANLKMNNLYEGECAFGIHAKKIRVYPNVNIDARLGGYLFEANNQDEPMNGNVEISQGALISAQIYPGLQRSGLTSVYGIHASGNFGITNAELFIQIHVQYSNIYADDQGFGNVEGIDILNGEMQILNGALVDVSINSEAAPRYYIGEMDGIVAGRGSMFVEDSVVRVACLSRNTSFGGGIAVNKFRPKTSRIDVDVLAGFSARGIFAKEEMNVISSDIRVECAYTSEQAGASAYGMYSGVMGSDLTPAVVGSIIFDNLSSIRCRTNGMALFAFNGSGATEKGYDAGYTPTCISLNSSLLRISDMALNQASSQKSASTFAYIEVLYKEASTANRAISEMFVYGK